MFSIPIHARSFLFVINMMLNHRIDLSEPSITDISLETKWVKGLPCSKDALIEVNFDLVGNNFAFGGTRNHSSLTTLYFGPVIYWLSSEVAQLPRFESGRTRALHFLYQLIFNENKYVEQIFISLFWYHQQKYLVCKIVHNRRYTILIMVKLSKLDGCHFNCL